MKLKKKTLSDFLTPPLKFYLLILDKEIFLLHPQTNLFVNQNLSE